MEDALRSISHGMDEALNQTLNRIQSQPPSRARLGMSALMWIAFANSPLTATELREVLAIRPGAKTLNQKYRPSQRLITECCQGLVTIDEEDSGIHLVHYAIQEFLEDQSERIFPSAQDELAEACLTYLHFDVFAQGCCDDPSDIRKRIEEYPLLPYAARHWGSHVRKSRDKKVQYLTLNLLSSAPRRAFSTQIQCFSQGYREIYWEADEANSQSALHIACNFGLQSVAYQILDNKYVDVDAATHMGTTALIRAASSGHIELVQMLLKKGADPTKSNWYGSALHCAAEAGRSQVVKILADTGMDVDLRDNFGRTSLHCAAAEGHLSTIEALLDKGADLNARDEEGQMMIHYAARRGYEGLLWRLLKEGKVDAAAKGVAGETMLHGAASGDKRNIIRLLLKFGAPIDAGDDRGYTPLHYATLSGKKEVAAMLIEEGADVNVEAKDGFTTISFVRSVLRGLEAKTGVSVDIKTQYPQEATEALATMIAGLVLIEPKARRVRASSACQNCRARKVKVFLE